MKKVEAEIYREIRTLKHPGSFQSFMTLLIYSRRLFTSNEPSFRGESCTYFFYKSIVRYVRNQREYSTVISLRAACMRNHDIK